MRHLTTILLPLVLLVAATGCGGDAAGHKAKLNVKPGPYGERIDYLRYEEALFALDTSEAHFQAGLKALQADYLPFLDGDLDDPEAVRYLRSFVTDPYIRRLHDKVEAAFPDLEAVRGMVEGVFAHFRHYYPDVRLPRKAYTCVAGLSHDTPPVMTDGESLIISLDWYLGKDPVYDEFGIPRYIAERTERAALAKDVAACLYQAYIYKWRKETTLSDEMVGAGKEKYFIEAMAPDLPDHVLLGYTPEQMRWAVENEGDLWADIVGNRRLYDSGLDMHMTFLADGPFTQEYSNEAPARLGEFIGLQIVRSYMTRNDSVSLTRLMSDGDLQGILQASGYKPRK